MNDKGDCRTAPATPGLIIRRAYTIYYTEDIFFPKIFFLADLCFVVFSQTSLMDRGEIGKLPTFVNIPAAHRCNQGTSKRVMRVVNVIMVVGSRFFCLAPCLYVWNSFNLVAEFLVTPKFGVLLRIRSN